MTLSEAYSRIKPSIVAFIAKYEPVLNETDPAPTFYRIFGTGVVVRDDGLIATNAHVVQAFRSEFRPPGLPDAENHVAALLFHRTEQAVVDVRLEIAGTAEIEAFPRRGRAYYGDPDGPDLAFVQVRARELPTATITSGLVPEEGVEVATAGYPMGRDALAPQGWIEQPTPTLQRGIVSAVLPFPCPAPHAFTINVMALGGASGSPVFLCDTGELVGLLNAGLTEAIGVEGTHRVPITISYVVPSHYLLSCIRALENVPEMHPGADAQTFEELIASSRFVDASDARLWQRRRGETPEESPVVRSVRVHGADETRPPSRSSPMR